MKVKRYAVCVLSTSMRWYITTYAGSINGALMAMNRWIYDDPKVSMCIQDESREVEDRILIKYTYGKYDVYENVYPLE